MKPTEGGALEAAVILTATSSEEAVEMENEYLSGRFGIRGVEWDKVGQSLVFQADRYFDSIHIQVRGRSEMIYFDITTAWAGNHDREKILGKATQKHETSAASVFQPSFLEEAMQHLHLAVIEARWGNHTEWSVRPYYETLASIFCNNPNAYHYEMFNNAGSFRESLPGVARTVGIRNIVIAAHSDLSALEGARGNRISRSILYKAIWEITKPIGLFLAGCALTHEKNAEFLLEDRGDKEGVKLQWIGGYKKDVDWLRAAAFELLFWTIFYEEQKRPGNSGQRLARVCSRVRYLASGLVDELGVGIFVRGKGFKRGQQSHPVRNLLARNDE